MKSQFYLTGGSAPVTSVFGRTGAIVATSGDYTATQVINTPAGNIASINVQTALNELDTEKAPLISPALSGTPTAPTATPGTSTTQLATTAFVTSGIDSAITGLSWKNAVQVATTANISLDNTTTIVDGYTLINGDRILVKNQTTQSQNGIYIVNTGGAWSRSTDTDTASEIDQSAVYVKRGTTQATTGWVLSNTGTITLGSTALTYAQFSGNGSYSAGA